MKGIFGHYMIIYFFGANAVKAAFEAKAYIALIKSVTKYTTF